MEAGMQRLVAIFFVLALISSGYPPTLKSAAVAPENDSAALKADSDLQLALKNKDAKAIGKLLDQNFSWTNEKGQTETREKFVRDAAAGMANAEYSGVKAHDYGELAVVSGTGKQAEGAETFFARVWVKRTAGWLLLTHQDTPILAKSAAPPPPSPAANPSSPQPGCENPCRTLPVTPKTDAEKAVFKAYQAVETAVTSHDAKTWAYHVADEFAGIGRQYTGSPDTKAARVGQIGVASNRVVLPKMLRGEAFVFGDAAIILADHQPVGEPPYHVIRVWVNRDGRWQLFHRQETTIR
jgi:hypothetical protein